MTELEEATKEGRVDARDGTGTKTKTEAKYYVKKMTSDEASIKKGHSKSDILLGPLKKLTSSTSTDDLKSKEKKAKKDERPEEKKDSTFEDLVANGSERDGADSADSIWKRGKKERWFVDPSEIKLPKLNMAAGACGLVYKTRWRSINIAVKTIKNSDKKSEPDQKRAVEDIQKEIHTWSTTRHPNIVTFLGASVCPKRGVMILMEFMERGDLQQLLDRNKGKIIPRKRAFEIALDISRAMLFLHACKPPIIHRDLKPPNVLFDANGVAKLADFGLSKFVTSHLENYRMTAKTGTIRYMAPEVLLGKNYSCSVDVYSFGMILSYMFSGCKPFSGFTVTKRVEHAQKAKEADLPRNLSPDVMGLISQCVCLDPSKRTSMAKVVEVLELLKTSNKACCTLM